MIKSWYQYRKYKKKRGKVKKITKEGTAMTHSKDALKGIMRPQAICQQTEVA